MGQGPDVGGSEARPAPRLTGRKAMKQLQVIVAHPVQQNFRGAPAARVLILFVSVDQEAIKRSDLATTMEMLAITGVGARNKNGFSALHFSVVYDELAIAGTSPFVSRIVEAIGSDLSAPGLLLASSRRLARQTG